MKAFIVAGGLGTRLLPETLNTPKALFKIANKPIVQHQIEFLRDNGIRDITLIIHYKAEQIKKYFMNGRELNVNICYLEEPELMGTAGWLNLVTQKLKEDFLVLYGDLFLKLDLVKFIKYHKALPSDNVATIIAQPKEYPLECDHFLTDNQNQIKKILFRPHKNNQVENNLANGSIYILRPAIFDYIPNQKIISFEKDIFNTIISSSRHRVHAYISNEYFKDIGTPERIKEVEEDIYFSRI